MKCATGLQYLQQINISIHCCNNKKAALVQAALEWTKKFMVEGGWVLSESPALTTCLQLNRMTCRVVLVFFTMEGQREVCSCLKRPLLRDNATGNQLLTEGVCSLTFTPVLRIEQHD